METLQQWAATRVREELEKADAADAKACAAQELRRRALSQMRRLGAGAVGPAIAAEVAREVRDRAKFESRDHRRRARVLAPLGLTGTLRDDPYGLAGLEPF